MYKFKSEDFVIALDTKCGVFRINDIIEIETRKSGNVVGKLIKADCRSLTLDVSRKFEQKTYFVDYENICKIKHTIN